MNAELKYNGYTAQPSDYECQDGDLAAVLNLMPEKGALHPVSKPKKVLHLCYTHLKLITIHEGAFGTHYIIYSTYFRRFYWLDSNSYAGTWTNYKQVASTVFDTYHNVACIGNVLVILTPTGMKYYVWEITGYKDLGSLPELTMQFCTGTGRTFGQYRYDDLGTSGIPKSNDTGFVRVLSPYNLSEANQNAVTEPLLAQANKAVAEVHDAGYFIFPFFVRYAFRMYDGSTTKASAPILMLPTTMTPFIPMTYEGNNFYFYVYAKLLKYFINDGTELTNLLKWKDIITSVDIFISAPIYTYDQSGKCKRLMPAGYANKDYYDSSYSGTVGVMGENLGNGFYGANDGSLTVMQKDGGTAAFELPQFESLLDKFKDVSTFYLFHSIPIGELVSETLTTIDAKANYLGSLVARETLKDDYDSHDTYIPKGAYNYNARLNIFGMQKTKFQGFHPSSCFPRITSGTASQVWVEDGYYTSDYEEGRGDDTRQYWVDTSHWETRYSGDYWLIDCFVHLKTDGYETVVARYNSGKVRFGQYGIPRWFFYPDAKAYKAVFVVQHIDPDANSQENNVQVYLVELQLKPHEYLNGAYYFNGFEPPAYTYITQYNNREQQLDLRDLEEIAATPSSCKPFDAVNNVLPALNKIYTSEVNNPFVYAVTNINTIGNGEIIGIATAAKALSQGQFGQFPMYAFTTDGVWALEVSSATGAFSAKQPITRDVCINPDSITQIDSAVLFATDRGIMLISGSQTQCITEPIDNNEEPFDFASLPLSSNIKAQLGITAGTGDALTEKKFSLFLEDCQMLYAYNRQAIIVFSPSFSGYAYIYSLETKQWGKIESKIAKRIPSYPEALASMENGDVVDFSNEEEYNDSSRIQIYPNQFLLTRPIKLDASLKDVHKTIDTIITRGNFTRGHVKTVLYGSRDLHSWFPIYTSVDHFLRHFRGTPYKYFRIALICSLTHDESIWGSSIQYTPKLTNQPR